MTAFDKNFLFLDVPDGSVENLAAIKAAGFSGVFGNVRNYPPSQWTLIRQRAAAEGMFCGPWGRTAKLDSNGNQIEPAIFDPAIVDLIVQTADNWNSPGLINGEKELDKHQEHLDYIVAKVGTRDFALSVQPTPFSSIDWKVAAHLPVLPQIFPAEVPGYEPLPTRNVWWLRGIKCVYMTYGTYGGMKPSDFALKTPYSLFTGNACGGVFDPWKPTSTGWVACSPKEEKPVEEVVASLKAAWNNQYASNPAKNWRLGNPGEWSKILAYWNNETSTPPQVASLYGKGLVKIAEARRYADGTHA